MLLSHLFESHAHQFSQPLFTEPKHGGITHWDYTSGLWLNNPRAWSESPYVGAVRRGLGYIAQAHIPQDVWHQVLNDSMWQGIIPSGYLEPLGNSRNPVILGYSGSARPAAWIAQRFLYGGDTAELLEQYLLDRYIDQTWSPRQGMWPLLAKDMPEFLGDEYTVKDLDIIDWSKKSVSKEKQLMINKQEFPQRRRRQISRELALWLIKRARSRFNITLTPKQADEISQELIGIYPLTFWVDNNLPMWPSKPFGELSANNPGFRDDADQLIKNS